MTSVTVTPPAELAFPFLRSNERPAKPRARGVTEIRGPYYSVMGPRYLEDVLETMRDNLNDGFWATPTERPYLFLLDGWIVLTVASLCRMLTTIEEGEIVTKSVALKRWRDRLPARWCPLIDEAWRIRYHLRAPSLYSSRLKRVREVKAFIEYVRERGGKVYQATAQR